MESKPVISNDIWITDDKHKKRTHLIITHGRSFTKVNTKCRYSKARFLERLSPKFKVYNQNTFGSREGQSQVMFFNHPPNRDLFRWENLQILFLVLPHHFTLLWSLTLGINWSVGVSTPSDVNIVQDIIYKKKQKN